MVLCACLYQFVECFIRSLSPHGLPYSEELWWQSALFRESLILIPSLVRPEFTGTLAIKSGRHPILENVQSAGMLVPNDVYCSDCTAFQVIQGPK